MQRKILLTVAILLMLLLLFLGVVLFGPSTQFQAPYQYLYLRTHQTDRLKIQEQIRAGSFTNREQLLFTFMDYWKVWPRIKPGKYKIHKGMSLFSIVRMFRNNQQEAVDLILTKVRTKKDFAALVGKKMECDSLQMIQFLNSNDSLKSFQADSNSIMTLVFPDTYRYYWSATPLDILQKMSDQHKRFWTKERLKQAANLGLTKEEIYILASIVEEETLQNKEKPLVASVYLNRLRKGMVLGADPTVKFAVGDFTLKRILFKHIQETSASPYNTYKNKGLPPGPICTPSSTTVDAVLQSPTTNYLFFCAKVNGNGFHVFAETDQEHLQNARAYQKWLNERNIR